jgi:hypothetical protein
MEIFMQEDQLAELADQHIPDKTLCNITTTMQKMNIDVKINIEKLEGNEEEEIDDWFDNFERIGNANGWTKEIKAIKLPCYLTDRALLVFQSAPLEKRQCYEDMKNLIKTRLTANFESHTQKFFNRTQKDAETVIEFALRLEKLSRKAFQNENREKYVLKVFWDDTPSRKSINYEVTCYR